MFELLDEKIQKLIKEKSWGNPTLAQQLAIKPILEGRNVLLIAPTGSGKTESVFLPILHKLVREEHKPIACLYITPLRALNRDLLDRLIWWCEHLGLEISVRHGDTTVYQRRKQLQFPDSILITTPESLQALLTGKKMREHLRNVKYVIIDEIHELIENKRGTQLSVGLERLRELSPFQTIGLSATVGSPEEVAKFLGSGKTEVVWAISQRDVDIMVEAPSPTEEDVKASESLYIPIDVACRLRRIKELIETHKSTLVFTNTREAAEILSSRLRSLKKDFEHSVHHSSLSKNVRIEAESAFKEERLKALICTSSLELGIDIGSIDLIVQYQSPRQVSKLTQRVGRSGHSVGKISKGIIISSTPDDIFEATIIAKRAMSGKLEKLRTHENALDVLANQIVGMSLEEYQLNEDKAFGIVKRSYLYRDLKKEDFLRILKFLENLRMLWSNQGIRRGRKAWDYYYSNLSTIPDVNSYRVIDVIEGNEVGKLDEAFVAEHAHAGSTFIVKGRPWKILTVLSNTIEVEPAEDIEGAVPAWEGELIPVPKDVAEGVADFRKKIEKYIEEKKEIKELLREYPVSDEALRKLFDYVKSQKDGGFKIPGRELAIEEGLDFVVIHSCNGTMINETISRYLAGKLTSGSSVGIKSDPYRIMIQGASKEAVLNVLRGDHSDMEAVVEGVLDRTQLFKWRFFHVAKRFGAIMKDAKWDKINMKRLLEGFSSTPIVEEAKREILVEKLDMDGAKGLIDKIRLREIDIIEQPLSPIGKAGLEQKFRELVAPIRPEKEIFAAFRERLLSTRMRLVCMRCANPLYTKEVRGIEKEPKCFKCSSRLVTVLKPSQRDMDVLIKKGIKGTIKTEEKDIYRRLENNAELVLTYGNKVIVALAGRGIGAETAIRILARQRIDEDEFHRDILEAERQYAKTKKFWAV